MQINVTHSIGDVVFVVACAALIMREITIRSVHISLYRGMDGEVKQQESYNNGSDDSFGLGGMVNGIFETFTNKEDAKAYIFEKL